MAVLTHCQMSGNPCSNQEIHVLFEQGFKFNNTTLNESLVIIESIADQNDHFADAFVQGNVVYGYDDVATF